MSDEEDNNTNEEEEEENEEGEGEEGEDEEGEGEEGEDEENEEGEDEEGEEDEDDDDQKKKKKKDASSTQKFETEKLVPQNEIKIDLSNGMPSNDTITMANIPVEKPKSIFAILSEINSEMDALSTELNTTLSIIENKNIDRENEEMRELLNKANQITRDIDIMENIPKPVQVENKCVQSDDEDNYPSSPESHKYMNTNENNNFQQPQQMRQFSYDTNNKRDFPYDPDKNKYYYSSLSSNNIPTMNSNRPNYNTSRVKRMDELYQGRQFGNRMPVIYSQNEVNGSRSFGTERVSDMNGSFRQNQMMNNNSNYAYSQMQPQRPFERYKPGNISQAMDILLDKQ